MPYTEKEFKTTNINYSNKDFSSFKNSLIEYSKTYFPNSYRDFNETSPGMMLIEMAAYVGDVLSFYIDQQYREMMLPLAEERRNVVNLAKMLGYKVKPITPGYVDVKVQMTVDATGDINNKIPDYSQAMVLDKQLILTSNTDDSIHYQTLEEVDFTVSSSTTPPEPADTDADGIVNSYTLTRYVRAISGETKTVNISVGSPNKFKKISLSETNVIDIESVVDASGNTWYEVDYLAQDKAPVETHYTSDWSSGASVNTSDRVNAYIDLDGNTLSVPVPYQLSYRKTSKRFIVEVNENNITSLVFGNGILRTGTTGSLETGFLQTDQAGFTIPGDENSYDFLNPFLANETSTLGEAPSNTTLTITYRVGGGIGANVPSGDLALSSKTIIGGSDNGTVTGQNEQPARGGGDGESIEEIRHKASAFFTTQNRCVTKEDYEARIMNLPSKFGSIAKVYVKRNTFETLDTSNMMASNISGLYEALFNYYSDPTLGNGSLVGMDPASLTEFLNIKDDGTINMDDVESVQKIVQLLQNESNAENKVATIEAFVLSYDQNKNLVKTPQMIKNNIKQYLKEFRIITDEVILRDGFIANFGVVFDVVAHRTVNKAEVKVRCIEKITEYFDNQKMQFRQPIYLSDLQYELMGIDGVRSVNEVVLTQGPDYSGIAGSDIFGEGLYYKDDITGDNGGATENAQYNWKYDFINATSMGNVLPAIDPTVFELKNPKQNIKGIVR